MEILKETIAILSAIIALATAWIGYKQLKKNQGIAHPQDLKLKHYENQSINLRKQQIRIIKIAMIVLLMTGCIGFSVYYKDVWVSIGFMSLGIIISVLMLISRNEPTDRTKKKAEYVFQLSKKEVMHRANRALDRMGCKIGFYDEDLGTIAAKKSFNFWTTGEILKVEVSDNEDGNVTLVIESDLSFPLAIYDSGRNAKNIEEFYNEMMIQK